MKITIDLEENQIKALSQVLKRISIDDIKKLSEDDKQAYDCMFAIEEIRKVL